MGKNVAANTRKLRANRTSVTKYAYCGVVDLRYIFVLYGKLSKCKEKTLTLIEIAQLGIDRNYHKTFADAFCGFCLQKLI
jgi:hypothetical protein